ncbi:MAG: hypothetical protein ACRDKY_03395 [Solirubrobacteraceae bacterium]
MIERITRLREESTRSSRREALLEDIEDALSEGYARALTGDAWSEQTEHRLHELLTDIDVPARGRTLRMLAREHTGFQAELIALRRELAELQRDRDRLRAGSAAHSS